MSYLAIATTSILIFLVGTLVAMRLKQFNKAESANEIVSVTLKRALIGGALIMILATIGLIADDWVANVGHVYSDLMGTPGF